MRPQRKPRPRWSQTPQGRIKPALFRKARDMVLRRLREMQKEYGENNFDGLDPQLNRMINRYQTRIFWTGMIKGGHVVRSLNGGYTLAEHADDQPDEQEARLRALEDLEQLLGKDWAKQ